MQSNSLGEYICYGIYHNYSDEIHQEYILFNKYDHSYLGKISYYDKWKKYCFYPERDTLFDSSCLLEIVNFIQTIKY